MLPEAGSIARNGAIAGIYAPFPPSCRCADRTAVQGTGKTGRVKYLLM